MAQAPEHRLHRFIGLAVDKAVHYQWRRTTAFFLADDPGEHLFRLLRAHVQQFLGMQNVVIQPKGVQAGAP